jgi:hypothetical protein
MGSMITFSSKGDFDKTTRFLKRMTDGSIYKSLSRYGAQGVTALAGATPVDSNLAANSWGYEVTHDGGGWSLIWTNSDIENGFPVAIMIQLGHGTGTGGYVAGRDYINPAIRPIFDQIADAVWKEVTQ